MRKSSPRRIISAWRRDTRSAPRLSAERSISGASPDFSARPITVNALASANSNPSAIRRAAAAALLESTTPLPAASERTLALEAIAGVDGLVVAPGATESRIGLGGGFAEAGVAL